jgi:hypothetical protein
MLSLGTWSLDQPGVLRLRPADGGMTEMKIVSVKPDKLVIKKT